MVDTSKFWLAAHKAERFLTQNGYDALPIDPFEIAEGLEISVQPKPDTEVGVSGMLLRHGNNFGIMYATHIPNEGFQRFSVAHELGHYLLEGHIDQVLGDGGLHSSRAGFASVDRYELEADHFAAGLLMPGSLFDRELARLENGLGAVLEMSERCRTSLVSAAIRYAERARDCIAIVVSKGSVVDYCFMSEGLRAFGELQWPRKKEPTPPGVLTTRFNELKANIADCRRAEQEIDLRDWFGGRRNLPGLEEVIGLGSYGRTLTVLSTEVTIEDEDEDEDLEESWEVGFR